MNLPQFLAAAVVGLAVLPVTAHAQGCVAVQQTNVQLNLTQIGELLSGKLVCGRPGSGYTGNAADRWQQIHLGNVRGGDLWDYKRGLGHPVDPSEKVGNWFVGGSRTTATVTYAYSPTVAYTWRVFGPAINTPGSVYSFCSPTGTVQQVRAFVVTNGGSGCSTFPP